MDRHHDHDHPATGPLPLSPETVAALADDLGIPAERVREADAIAREQARAERRARERRAAGARRWWGPRR